MSDWPQPIGDLNGKQVKLLRGLQQLGLVARKKGTKAWAVA